MASFQACGAKSDCERLVISVEGWSFMQIDVRSTKYEYKYPM